jgi:hypothetical protein
VAHFSDGEIIDLLNILRRIAKAIDIIIVAEIDIDKIITIEFKKSYQNLVNSGDTDRLKRKFKHFARVTMGVNYTEQAIEQIWGK